MTATARRLARCADGPGLSVAGWRRVAGRVATALAMLLVAGCSTFHPWQNQPASGDEVGPPPAPTAEQPVVAVVALSGGGARAAAFGLGVMQEMKATEFTLQGRPTTLLDEVTLISGVSGGSILAAHYAVFGDESLTRFETEFLLNNFQGGLVQLALTPRRMFRLSSPWYGRSHVLADRLDTLYEGRTFGDLGARTGGPELLVVATDLTTGAPFEFTREQFALICSDLSSVPLSFAVAASSAVPIALTPLSLRNYADGCEGSSVPWPESTDENFRVRLMRTNAEGYLDAERRPFVHLVDGGLNDNLGIRRLLDRLIASGSLSDHFRDAAPGSIRKVVLIAVNAQRDPGEHIDHSDHVPSTRQVGQSLMFGVGGQITQVTLAILGDDTDRWHRELLDQRGTPGSPFAADAELYVISISLRDVEETTLRDAILLVPTAFSIEAKQVQMLLAAGRDALRDSPEFQRLRHALSADFAAESAAIESERTGAFALNHK